MSTITNVLVANRAEIARRVFATCRRLGIGTVAVHSDADAGLPFVREADRAVHLPGNSPAETYLDIDALLEAARRSGADAVHPGYGFLSENAAFARAVQQAGLTWIGPDPASIDSMGSKVAAKRLMSAAGVPVFTEIDPADVTEADLPILVKASAGGGGRGMRVVRRLEDLADTVAQAAEEARSAFGDPTVFCEPYLENGRHVEVQVLGDSHGTVAVLGERDCSLQRRHQKIVEEAPAPGLSEQVRQVLHEGARRAAEAISYVGAGTVEFMVSGERVSFLEMNTRLQVEHPVTEAVLGLDLVEQQIAVAEGARLDLEPRRPRGHAVEVRLYAEDPSSGYAPQSGRLSRLEIDHDAEFEAPFAHAAGVRLDAGFDSGSEVSTFYDAMLAKVIAWAPTRESAFRRLAGVMERARVHGLITNRDQLVALLRNEDVLAGRMSTTMLDQGGNATPLLGASPDVRPAAVAAALALAEHARLRRTVQQGVPVAWRNVVSQPQRTRLIRGDTEHEVAWYGGRDGYRVEGVDVLAAGADEVVLALDGVATRYAVEVEDLAGGRQRRVHVDGPGSSASFTLEPRFVDPAEQVGEGSLLAPMPGTVVSLAVERGEKVTAGQRMLVLEAMKMQHTVAAPLAGTVTEIAVEPGEQVAAGAVLAVVEPTEDTNEGDQA